MKILGKRILALERSFDFFDSDYSHLSIEELEVKIEGLALGMGYRRAVEGEIPEAELNEKEFIRQGVDPAIAYSTRQELNAHMMKMERRIDHVHET